MFLFLPFKLPTLCRQHETDHRDFAVIRFFMSIRGFLLLYAAGCMPAASMAS